MSSLSPHFLSGFETPKAPKVETKLRPSPGAKGAEISAVNLLALNLRLRPSFSTRASADRYLKGFTQQ